MNEETPYTVPQWTGQSVWQVLVPAPDAAYRREQQREADRFEAQSTAPVRTWREVHR